MKIKKDPFMAAVLKLVGRKRQRFKEALKKATRDESMFLLIHGKRVNKSIFKGTKGANA